MTPWEIVRLACYVIASIALLYKSLAMLHERRNGGALLRLFLVLLFVWYIAEVTMIGQGINTRDYRIIGTPMIVGITTVAVAQAIGVWKVRHSGQHGSQHGD